VFDPATANLVRAARPLPGLEPSALVEELTAAYIDIASARLALHAPADQPGPDLDILMARMRRLADTYESYITLELFPSQSRSAAFVAGAARQVMARIEALRGTAPEGPSRLDDDAIDGDIAAALLFLIAEQPSDALEAARAIRPAGGDIAPVRRALILAVRAFCQGAFRRVLAIDPDREGRGASDVFGVAANLLFRELLRGLRLLALAGLGEVGDEAIAEAQAMFARVRSLSVDAEGVEDAAAGASLEAVSLYAGPHHLAALLARASRTLSEAALVRTPCPAGADAATWGAWLRAEADRWPFLWPNHRDCLKTGYLDRGQSLVMTTPTGSGKTTLAALKIAATLAGGRTVLYLAPTHALVGQVERDLNERVGAIARAKSIEDISLDDAVDTLPDLAVVTPERCFALLTFAPELFESVGLMVFDEFHLLGVARPATAASPVRIGRRGIDAMLCLLTFLNRQPDADVLLLSAMVSNGADVAGWLAGLMGRPVQVFDDRWKPTRQLRACLTYNQADLDGLRTALIRAEVGLGPAPVLSALPFGLFSLVSGWNPGAPDKLLVRPFAQGPLPLKKGLGAWVTSNRGEVAAGIARSFAAAGLKVIVFCENIRMCGSVARTLNQDPGGTVPPAWTGEQAVLRDSLIDEVGAAGAVYDAGAQRAAVHHGELLRAERDLVEALFRDPASGVDVLAATSTLAQGLNLPCEVVILAGTDRLDEGEGAARMPLLAHEVLNALGRAGRAGQASTGLAIVVPAVPLGCNLATKAVSAQEDVRVVFSDTDQCLPLEDPLAALFDQIEQDGVTGDEADYLLRRLSVSFDATRPGVEGFESLARRTFGFWRRAQADPAAAQQWLAQRRATLEASLALVAPLPQLPWQEELAAKTGASAAFVAALSAAYPTAPLAAVEATDWIFWLLDQLDPTSSDFDVFLRPDTMKKVFGRAYPSLLARPGGRARLRLGVKSALTGWLTGLPLNQLEMDICAFIAANEGPVARPTRADGHAQHARRFALRLVPDLGFLCGVLAQVAAQLAADAGEPLAAPMVSFLPTLVRHGCRTPYHYLIRRTLEAPSRPGVEARFARIAAALDRQPTDDWAAVRDKVDTALTAAAFDWSPEDLYALRELLAAEASATET
jgi:hypothetical protein